MATHEHSATAAASGSHPARRIDVEPCAARVRVELGGEVVADSARTLLLYEESYPPVHYFPRDDVRMDLLTPTAHATRCPYKGGASYWTVEAGERTAENAVWSYEDPIPRDDRHRRLPRLLPRPHGRLVGGGRSPGLTQDARSSPDAPVGRAPPPSAGPLPASRAGARSRSSVTAPGPRVSSLPREPARTAARRHARRGDGGRAVPG